MGSSKNKLTGTERAAKNRINQRTLGLQSINPREKNRYTCVCCGQEQLGTRFYKASGSLAWNTEDKISLICKNCAQKLFEHYRDQYTERIAVICLCHILDIPYEPHIYEASQLVLPNEEPFKFSHYVMKLQKMSGVAQRKCFADSIANGEIVFAAKNGGTETGEGLDVPIEPEDLVSYSKTNHIPSMIAPGENQTAAWSRDEVQNKNFVVTTVGYDPFSNLELNIQELKFCYNVMASYCDSDGIQGDGHKLQSAVELTLTQLQSRRVNELIQKEMNKPSPNEATIKTLSETKRNFQQMVSKIAEDNKFSSANNEASRPGRHTFTGKMKELAENDYEAIKVNLYDSKTSKAMKQIADLSNRAILDQLALDANDYAEMLKEQREKILQLQRDRDYFEEKARTLNNKLEVFSKGKKGG